MKHLIFFLILFSTLSADETSNKARTLYSSIDPTSIPQHLALYELYPNTPAGQQALRDAWRLLEGNEKMGDLTAPNPSFSITTALIRLINKQPNEESPQLTEKELETISKLGQRLANRSLKGFQATDESFVSKLPPHEIDLARGVFLSDGQSLDTIRNYEATLDLMALQILARVPIDAPPKDKIRAMNHLIFREMGFRFPPHSLYAKDIDLYTFLPSVLDSRKGVCLGVSILYLALAQRINLPLEIVTPPGHIYIRYREGEDIVNIETTAFGIDMDSETYLSVGTRSLQSRNLKEVIGLAHVNQASVYLSEEKFDESLKAYQKAFQYLPEDLMVKELLGYNYIFVGEESKGKKLLQSVQHSIPEHGIVKETVAEDLLQGRVSAEGVKALFMHTDETRESILKKKERLEKELEHYPQFRSGWFTLAISWLQLHREKEALEVLEHFHSIDPNDPTAEYYLAALYADRTNFNQAWKHLRLSEKICAKREHHPKALRQLERALAMRCPE